MATENKNLSQYDKNTLPNVSQLSFGIVVSEWNETITEGLFKGALDTLLDCNVKPENVIRWNVPGSFELIYGCKKMMEKHPHLAGIIAIGSVIQGETKHFDFVCEGVTHGIKDLNLLGKMPVIFCVLTDNNMQQSLDRSGGKHGNKGVEAAVAAIKMTAL
ncbi:6,7-dimethyl-8-ribityllumazine synthase [Flavobacterium filum]|uniref:6,7-dimethyl-8-ribityllumazine synthase n=1 Tax=Flavobacterium filum TaxID=370974 RepID=UPI0023F228DF|nr:6,7-dimethyl-8-ribityllumazine synthase [Flavobacterium filum]